MGSDITRFRIEATRTGTSITLKGNGVEINRYFEKDKDGNLTVDHAYFELEKSMQGKGFSKTILQTFYEEYRAIGVSKIKVDANFDVGGYTWARYGFNANRKTDAITALSNSLEAIKFINDYYVKNGLSEDKPFPMFLLTEQPWGKNTLLGSYWHGHLDLTDPKQVAQFEKYLFSRR